MIIDTVAKTVIFPVETKVTVSQLWSLIELLDPFDLDDVVDVETPTPDGWISFDLDVVQIYAVPSQTSRYTYTVVRFADGSWACSCPDWTKRKSKMAVFSSCKHIIYKMNHFPVMW